MTKNTFWLSLTLFLGLFTLYTGLSGGFDFRVALTISRHGLTANGSMTLLFAVLTLVSGLKYLIGHFFKSRQS